MPAGWAEASLDEVADVRLGRQRSPKNHTGARMRPYLRAANIKWGGLDLTDVKQMNFSEAESSTFELRPGDVLVAEASGSASEVGKPAIWNGEIANCCFQNTLLRLRSTGPIPEYLYYFLLAEAGSGRLGAAAAGVGIHHIGAARLSRWRIPIPPRAEQLSIVATIDEHFSRLDAASEVLESAYIRAGILATSILEHAGRQHARLPLGDIATSMRYGTSLKCLDDASGPAVLRIPNIRGGSLDLSNLKFATVSASGLGDSFVEPGDLLFVRTNGSRDLIGRVAPVREVGAERLAFASYLIRARPNPDVLDASWAAYALRAPRLRADIESLAATTAGQYNLNLASLRSLKIPVPPLVEQRILVAAIDRQLSLVGALRREVAKVRTRQLALRQAVLDHAFRGDLIPGRPSFRAETSSLLEEVS